MLKKTVYEKQPHQLEALKKIRAYFKTKNRGKLPMPCGTGKTLIGYWTTLELDSMTVVVAVPNIHLVGQALKDWRVQSNGENVDIAFLCVCSDETVTGEHGSTEELKARNSDIQVTTDPAEISSWIKSTKGQRRVIFTTYQSSDVVCLALKRTKVDLIVFDEAHRTTGNDDKLFSIMLSDDNIRASKRLYMTATERFYTGVKDNVLSMDDIEIYGDVIYSMSFKYAIQNKLICDYRIVTLAITQKDLLAICQENRMLKDSDKNVSDEAVMIASMIAVRRQMDKEGLSHGIAYTNTIDRAKRFSSLAEVDIGTEPIESFHISGEMSGRERNGIMESFTNSDKAIISNAKCLQEGIDISCVDLVAFIDPKKSTVDTVQSSCRALRRHQGKKMAYIVIPVFLDTDGNLSDHQKAYEPAVRMISSLASVDERIIEQFSTIGQNRQGGGGGGEIVQHHGDLTNVNLDELMLNLSENILESTRKLVGFATLEEHQRWCLANGIDTQSSYRSAKKPQNFYPSSPWKAFGMQSNEFFGKTSIRKSLECHKTFCLQNGINSKSKYDRAKKPNGFYSTPWIVYGISVREFFGNVAIEYATIEEHQEWCKGNGITNNVCYAASERPGNFYSLPWSRFGVDSKEFFGKTKTVSFETCKKWCLENGVYSAKKYRASEKPEGFPCHPWRVYKVSCTELFQNEIVDQETCLSWCRENGIVTITAYHTAKKPRQFPHSPQSYYGIKSKEFFGTTFVDLETCLSWCRKNGVSSRAKYRSAERPAGFPAMPWGTLGGMKASEFFSLVVPCFESATDKVRKIMKTGRAVRIKDLEGSGSYEGMARNRTRMWWLVKNGEAVKLPDGSYVSLKAKETATKVEGIPA